PGNVGDLAVGCRELLPRLWGAVLLQRLLELAIEFQGIAQHRRAQPFQTWFPQEGRVPGEGLEALQGLHSRLEPPLLAATSHRLPIASRSKLAIGILFFEGDLLGAKAL